MNWKEFGEGNLQELMTNQLWGRRKKNLRWFPDFRFRCQNAEKMQKLDLGHCSNFDFLKPQLVHL